MAGRVLVLSCEHGGPRVPPGFAYLFDNPTARRLLATHRGWDPGALAVARALAGALDAPLHAAQVTRLLVDLNRSPHHRDLFSVYSRRLDPASRERVLAQHYRPYRDALQAHIHGAIRGGRRVLHVSVHSFTPVLHGEPRRADIGLLYDPGRRRETELAQGWHAALRISGCHT